MKAFLQSGRGSNGKHISKSMQCTAVVVYADRFSAKSKLRMFMHAWEGGVFTARTHTQALTCTRQWQQLLLSVV